MLLSVGCISIELPLKKENPHNIQFSHSIINESSYLQVHNKMKCPVRIILSDSNLNAGLEKIGFALFEADEKKTLSF